MADEFGGVPVEEDIQGPMPKVQGPRSAAVPTPTPVTFYSLGKTIGGADETEDSWTNRGFSARGPNLTPGVAAVNEKAIPLGTILKDTATGNVFLAADKHGNRDPSVVDVYVPPDRYQNAKVERNFEVVGKIEVNAIPKTAAGVRELLSKYGTVPEGESAADTLAKLRGGNAGQPKDEFGGVPVLEGEPARKFDVEKSATLKDGWNAFWGGIADSSLTIPQGIYRQAAETIANAPDRLFLEADDFRELRSLRDAQEMDDLLSSEESQADPEKITPFFGYERIRELEGKARAAKESGTAGMIRSEFERYADKFDEIRADYASAYDVSPEFQNSFMGQLISGAGQMVPQTVAAVLPGVGVAALQSQAFQYSWDDAKQAAQRQGVEFDPERAYTYALANSFQQALLEKAGVDAALGKWMKEGGKKTLANFTKRILTGAGGEGTTEALQGAVQDELAGGLGVDVRNPLDPGQRATEAAIGGILGGGLAGIHAAGERIMEGRESAPRDEFGGELVDVEQLAPGGTSEEQFEELARRAAAPPPEGAAPEPPAEPAPERAPAEDPFALEEEETEAEGYVPGGDAEAIEEQRRISQEQATARAEAEEEMREAMRAARESAGSVELLDAIEAAGGLPGKGNVHERAYRGELKMVRESAGKKTQMQLFRKNAPDPDRLVTSLRDMGFQIEGPNELWDLLDTRLRNGSEVWSEPAQQEDYWAQRMAMADMGPPGAAPEGYTANLARKKPIPVTEVTTPLFKAENPGAARRLAKEWLEDPANRIVGDHRNDDTGWMINVSKNGLGHGLHGSRNFPTEHLEAAAKLPDLLRHAVLAETHPDREGKLAAVHRFYAPLRIDNALYRVKITVKEDAQGHRFYDHSLTEIEAAPVGTPAPDTRVAPATAHTGATVTVTDLLRGATSNEGKPFFPETDGNPATDALSDGPLRVLSADGKNHYANVPLRGLKDIRIIEMPELLQIVRELTGNDPDLRRMRAALGQMIPQGDGQIRLDPRIFHDHTIAAKVLAHELGHIIDWLPDKYLKRGNIIGRLYTLRKHLSATAFGAKTGISNKKVREELIALTQYWKPWDEAASPAWYNDYRKSSVELYADALSVLFNSPATLKQMAPTFYREFFAWLDKKADVKTAFFEMQAFLHKPYMEVLRSRSADVQTMFGNAEEIFLRAKARRRAQHMNARGWIDTLKEQLYDRFNPIIKRQRQAEKAGAEIPDELRMDLLFDEHPLADNLTYTWLNRMWQRVVQPLEAAEITLEDLGEYLLFSRIMADRSGVANPKGHTPDTARAALLRMRTDMGIAKFTLLERGAERFHGYVFDTVREAAATGLISKETFRDVIQPNRKTYAAFRPIDYVEDYVPAGVYKQIGTLKEIENPWLTTILKTIAMRRAIQYQRAKTGTVKFLQRFFPGEIEAAETRWDGKRQAAVPPKDKEKALLEIRVDGKWTGYNVPADVARMFEQMDPAQASGIIRLLDWGFRKGFYNVWVRFNPVFQFAYSPLRDAQRFYTNMPKAGAIKLAANYLKSIPEAMRRLAGNDSPLITEMYETLALSTPHDSFARHMTRDDAFEEILRQFHILPPGEISAWRKNMIVRPILATLRGIEWGGQILEAAPKIAAYKVLTRDLGWNVRDAASYVRNYIGVPNYLRKGRHAHAAGAILPFWNVAVQGLSSDVALMTGQQKGKSAASWWFRWALAGGAYALIQALARVGLLGDDAEKWFGGVSEYDYANFMIVPLGTMPGGDHGQKVMYLRIPQDEMHRLTNGVLKKFIEIMAKHAKDETVRPLMNDVLELAGFSGGQLPGINPALGISAKWMDYMNGNNPYDSFRGKHILSNAEWLAGGWQSLNPMLGMTWNESGLGNFYRYNPESDTTTELVLGNTPVLQRLVKVSDRGYSEAQQEGIQRGQAISARLKAGMPRNAQKLVQEHNFLRSLGKKRTPNQEGRYRQLREWYRRIYEPRLEAAESSESAGVDYRPAFSGLEEASAAWE